MPIIHQAGAIVFRTDGPEPLVLLVTAKRNPQAWIFPKGHIEEGETPDRAALRETREEAGVVGELVGPAGVLEYGFLGAKARVQYFLVQYRQEAGPAEDGRRRSWCRLEDALEQLRYKNSQRLLRKAWKQLVNQ